VVRGLTIEWAQIRLFNSGLEMVKCSGGKMDPERIQVDGKTNWTRRLLQVCGEEIRNVTSGRKINQYRETRWLRLKANL